MKVKNISDQRQYLVILGDLLPGESVTISDETVAILKDEYDYLVGKYFKIIDDEPVEPPKNEPVELKPEPKEPELKEETPKKSIKRKVDDPIVTKKKVVKKVVKRKRG